MSHDCAHNHEKEISMGLELFGYDLGHIYYGYSSLRVCCSEIGES
jgi:hypothetical protein